MRGDHPDPDGRAAGADGRQDLRGRLSAQARAEHAANGGVYRGETLDALTAKFATLQGESYRVAESARIVRMLEETWRRGENPLTAVLTAASA